MSAVFLHGGQDGLGLVAGCFEGGTGDVTFLRILGDADYLNELACLTFEIQPEVLGLTDCALGVVDPVRRKKTAERRHKNTSSVIRDRKRKVVHFLGFLEEMEVVL